MVCPRNHLKIIVSMSLYRLRLHWWQLLDWNNHLYTDIWSLFIQPLIYKLEKPYTTDNCAHYLDRICAVNGWLIIRDECGYSITSRPICGDDDGQRSTSSLCCFFSFEQTNTYALPSVTHNYVRQPDIECASDGFYISTISAIKLLSLSHPLSIPQTMHPPPRPSAVAIYPSSKGMHHSTWSAVVVPWESINL